jgi:hypothetical protein
VQKRPLKTSLLSVSGFIVAGAAAILVGMGAKNSPLFKDGAITLGIIWLVIAFKETLDYIRGGSSAGQK